MNFDYKYLNEEEKQFLDEAKEKYGDIDFLLEFQDDGSWAFRKQTAKILLEAKRKGEDIKFLLKFNNKGGWAFRLLASLFLLKWKEEGKDVDYIMDFDIEGNWLYNYYINGSSCIEIANNMLKYREEDTKKRDAR